MILAIQKNHFYSTRVSSWVKLSSYVVYFSAFETSKLLVRYCAKIVSRLPAHTAKSPLESIENKSVSSFVGFQWSFPQVHKQTPTGIQQISTNHRDVGSKILIGGTWNFDSI